LYPCFRRPFSRLGIARASAALPIWLNENVEFHSSFSRLGIARTAFGSALGLSKTFGRNRKRSAASATDRHALKPEPPMFTEQDTACIRAHGLTPEAVERQLENF